MDTRLEEYLRLLFIWNPGAGLTAFGSPELARERGVAPSLEALPQLPENGEVLDVGSGGGFPAIPLVLARPGLRFTCCEPAAKKAAFLREASRVLGLHLRIEERAAEEFLRAATPEFDAVTVRGVRLRAPLLRLLVKSVRPGGRLLVWTGGETLTSYREAFGASGLRVLGERRLSEGSTLLWGDVPRGTPED